MYLLNDPVLGKPSMTAQVTEHHALAKSFAALFEAYGEKVRDYFVIKDRRYHLARLGNRKQKRDQKKGR